MPGDEEKETLWQRIAWWWTWRVWRPLRRRCSWCDMPMLRADQEDDPRVEQGTHGTRDSYLGWGAWACYGCIEYPEG